MKTQNLVSGLVLAGLLAACADQPTPPSPRSSQCAPTGYGASAPLAINFQLGTPDAATGDYPNGRQHFRPDISRDRSVLPTVAGWLCDHPKSANP